MSAIRAHGEETYPNECCGIVIGTIGPDENVTVARVTPARNLRDDSPQNRFEIDPGDFVKADRQARADKLSVVGFYHSHPDSPAKPSEYDREHAWPGYCYIIAFVNKGTAEDMTNWRLADDRSGFIKDEIVIEERD